VTGPSPSFPVISVKPTDASAVATATKSAMTRRRLSAELDFMRPVEVGDRIDVQAVTMTTDGASRPRGYRIE